MNQIDFWIDKENKAGYELRVTLKKRYLKRSDIYHNLILNSILNGFAEKKQKKW